MPSAQAKPVPSKTIPFDLYWIVWLDASGDTGWEKVSAIKEQHTVVTSVTFLIRKTRKHYLVGSSIYWDENEEEWNFGDRNHIPRGMVKSMTLMPKIAAGGDTPEPAKEAS